MEVDFQHAQELFNDLMEYYYSDGCACQYPRFRVVLCEIPGQIVGNYDAQMLFNSLKKYLEKENNTTYLCTKCSSEYTVKKAEFRGIIYNVFSLEMDEVIEQLGADVETPVKMFSNVTVGQYPISVQAKTYEECIDYLKKRKS